MDRALVDTDILSEILRAKDPSVARRREEYVAEVVARGWYRIARADRVQAFLAWLPQAGFAVRIENWRSM